MALLLLTLGACSDNIEQGLYADSTQNISLSMSVPGAGNGILTLAPSSAPVTVAVTSSTRWRVETTDKEGWCVVTYGEGDADGAGQLGDGSFVITPTVNTSAENRSCDVTVYAIDSSGDHIGYSQSVLVTQTGMRLAITSNGYDGAPLLPSASEFDVTVSANIPWKATANSWIAIAGGEGMEGNSFTPSEGSVDAQEVTLTVKVGQNTGSEQRAGEILFSSPAGDHVTTRISVIQQGTSFIVNATSELTGVPYGGGTVEFQVYSPNSSWTAAQQNGTWVTFAPASGVPDAQNVTVRATIAANTVNAERTARIIFSREGDGIGTTFEIVQQGNPNSTVTPPDPGPAPLTPPQIGTARVLEGVTSTRAEIVAYFTVTDIPAQGYGVFVTPEGNPAETRKVNASVVDDGLFRVEITGLSPATRYEAVPFLEYVRDGEACETRGSTLTFHTLAVPGPGTINPPVIE